MSISGGLLTHGKAKESRLTAVVTRADGTIENLGTIAYYSKNPLRRLLWQLRKYWEFYNGRL